MPENPNSPTDSTPDLTGRELGDYRILRRLGSGGMAEVYLAEQRSLSRQVAFKVLNHALATDASYVERFQNEARAAASLVHPNIVQIFEVGQAEGVHFIAQEYVAGKNLGQLLEREGAFQPALVLDVLRQVVSALCKAGGVHDRPSRHQAREHPAQQFRRSQSRRLWPSPRTKHRHQDAHPGRRGDGNAALHES